MQIRKPCHGKYIALQIGKIRAQKIRKLLLYGFTLHVYIVLFLDDIVRLIAFVVRSEFLAVVCSLRHALNLISYA